LQKKEMLSKESHIDELNSTINELTEEKEKHLLEIKNLKKINRMQDKELRDKIGPDAIRLMT
jgi:hypothetical protein